MLCVARESWIALVFDRISNFDVLADFVSVKHGHRDYEREGSRIAEIYERVDLWKIVLEHLEDDLAGVALAPAASDPPLPPQSGSGVTAGVEQLCLQAEVPVPLEPAHRGGIHRRQERGPGLYRIRRP